MNGAASRQSCPEEVAGVGAGCPELPPRLKSRDPESHEVGSGVFCLFPF